jgi:3',5'-cyclic AMP phosphodiesterase CpdA
VVRQAVAAALAGMGTVAGGFVVNGRHLSFGDDPTTQMWAGGQLFNISQYNAVPPRSIRVWVDYGLDRFYGCTVEAEIRELLAHVPVWDGQPGVLRASRTLNADQFFVHAYMVGLSPGTQYHYRFRYASGGEIGMTADDLSWEIQGLLGYSHGAQVRWLEDQLRAWRESLGIDFIVAFFHECAFSTCNGHSSDGGVRSELAPLFARYQVDLVVQGHSHVYERTNPLVYDPETNSARSSKQAVAVSPSEPAEVEPAKDGTTYVVVGTAGHRTTMVLRFVNEQGRELDRVVFSRTAGG